MSEDRAYYYVDRPSPLHDEIDSYLAARKSAAGVVDEITQSVGAESAAASQGFLGFAFKDKPDDKLWKDSGRRDQTNAKLYVPKKNTAVGKAIAARVSRVKYPSQQDIPHKIGLGVMRINGRYMLQTAVGWAKERAFVTVPTGGTGDSFNKPEYLTECRRWEMEKFIEEAGVAARADDAKATGESA